VTVLTAFASPANTIEAMRLGAHDHLTKPIGRSDLAAARDTVDGSVRLRLRVSDTGPGVDPAIRTSLFEPFVTGRPDGTGLGLAIVREIALAHRGTAGLVEHAPETTFCLDLPWRPS
jgi:hypothetical protein